MKNQAKIKMPVRWLLSGFFLLMALIAVNALLATTETNVAQAQRPPGGPQPSPIPNADITLEGVSTMVSPNILKPGEAMTYTVRVVAQGSLDGANVAVEMPLVGNQKLTRFDPRNTGFIQDNANAPDNTLRFTRPTMASREDLLFYVYATVPTDLPGTVFQQGLFTKWQDTNGYHTKAFNVKVAVDVPLGPVPPTNQPEPAPATPKPGDPILPATGPFAPQPTPDSPNTATRWYFWPTKHYLSNGFLDFWLKNGAVLNFSWPISEEFSENGTTVQYFENAVVEYQPNNPPGSEIQLRAIGRELDKAEAPVSSDTAPNGGAIYYPDTGHWMDERFVSYWQKNGGLAQFGYPIAEAKVQGNILIQWFERARLELDISKSVGLVDVAPAGKELAIAKGYIKVS